MIHLSLPTTNIFRIYQWELQANSENVAKKQNSKALTFQIISLGPTPEICIIFILSHIKCNGYGAELNHLLNKVGMKSFTNT